MTKTTYVIELSRDSEGPMYLGRLDLGRQGVRNIGNAIVYKTKGRAELVAADYHGVVRPLGRPLVEVFGS